MVEGALVLACCGIAGSDGMENATGAPLEAAFIDHVTARLAVHIGPIARIITKKAAQRAKGRSDFARLAAESLDLQDRSAFLR